MAQEHQRQESNVFAQQALRPQVESTGPRLNLKRYPLTGLGCASCAVKIQKTLDQEPGLDPVLLNFAAGYVLMNRKTRNT